MIPVAIEKLARHHVVDDFGCSQPALDEFLHRRALPSQLANASQTYVALTGSRVVGYYTLVVGEVHHDQAPERVLKGMPKHPIPLMVLARLAVDSAWQGKGLGSGLLKDAMLRTMNAADIAGIRALAVHAKDDSARTFYEHFGFQSSPTDVYHLFLLLKDLRRNLAE